MDIQDILNALNLGEDKDWEFKSAKGGLPGSLWETYSAMANTDGGVVVLGIKQRNEDFTVQGLDDPVKLMQDFWNLANNKGKISLNLLSNQDVSIKQVDGKSILVVCVPRASRIQRPVFVGGNPLDGTYRRYHEGDYRCSPEEVGRMLADQSEQPADCAILPHFGLDDLDKKSLEQYRNRFSSRSPTHPWLNKDERGFLEMLGGWRKDRATGQEGLTIAGLLMFGQEHSIQDSNAIPQYNVDYREHLSDDPSIRWTDRIWPDGTWPANLFQFFLRVYPRLVADLKIPFQLDKSSKFDVDLWEGVFGDVWGNAFMHRIDETIIHEGIREAFVNAMIHADFRGKGGIVVERFRDRLVFSNPGTLLVSIEQMLQGGVSECRNKSLQTMFAMVGYGEKAGSGVNKIAQGWASQKWRSPKIQTQLQPDRVRLVLPMVSLLPEVSLEKLQDGLGSDFADLNAEEVQALITAQIEGEVSNQRLQQFSRQHRTDITKTLQCLVSKGFLAKDGHGPWATYRLDGPLKGDEESAEAALTSSPHNAPSSPHNAPSSPHNAPSSPHNAPSSPHNAPSSPHNAPSSPHNATTDPDLLAIARPAREKGRLPPDQMERILLELCEGRYLSLQEIGDLVGRDPKNLRDRYLTPLSESGRLLRKHPKANDPKQAYTTGPDKDRA